MVARPEDTVETEQPKEQPLPLTPEEHPHPQSATEETEPHDNFPTDPPEERIYVDADAEVPEPEEYTLDPYDIMRDDPFARIPQEVVERWDEKRLHQQSHPHPNPQLQPPDHHHLLRKWRLL